MHNGKLRSKHKANLCIIIQRPALQLPIELQALFYYAFNLPAALVVNKNEGSL